MVNALIAGGGCRAARCRSSASASRDSRCTLPSSRSRRRSSAARRCSAACARTRRRCCARPRSSSPLTTTPTPTPSETLTNTRLRTGAATLRASHTCASAQARPEFSICTGKPGRRREAIAQVDVAPAQRRRMNHAAGSRHRPCPGTTTPMPQAGAGTSASAASSSRMRAARARDEALRIRRRRHADDVGSRLAHRVGEHQERAGRADVDGDARSLARVDVEQRRLAAARDFAGGALRRCGRRRAAPGRAARRRRAAFSSGARGRRARSAGGCRSARARSGG